MMKAFTRLQKCLMACLMTFSVAHANEVGDTVFIEQNDGSMFVIPREYIKTWSEDDAAISLRLSGNTIITVRKERLQSLTDHYAYEKPQMLSYKFNNKFNDQLYTDAFGNIDAEEGTIEVAVGCIGKRLTPSFQLTEGAEAYLGGVRQYSKVTRLRFDGVKEYCVAYPNHIVYTVSEKDGSTRGTEHIPGDVNGDGALNIADVTKLTNILTGKDSNYTRDWADVNQDGAVSAADTRFLIDIIMTLSDEEMQGGSLQSWEGAFVPYGNTYRVNVDFLTDHPTTDYSVPRIDITFGDGKTWSSSMWIGRNGQDYYEEATIEINGAGVFPDMEVTPMLIKGRGNTSWKDTHENKNSYRIKFDTKYKPFGLTNGKNWVLIGNYKAGSLTANAIGMKIADMIGTKGCNHIVPCELYVNGQYRGSYLFTEKIGFSNNSIDIADESNATMLELDSYYDETYKFRDSNYNLYVNVKEPDFDEGTTNLTFEQIVNAFNKLTSDIKRYPEQTKIDVESVATAMFVNDLIRNEEYKHPKSWFLYNTDITADSLWTLGPVWDFDWAYGFDKQKRYFMDLAETDLFEGVDATKAGYPFFKQLFRGSQKVKTAYRNLWNDFMNSEKLEELIEFCDDYYDYVKKSLQHNSTIWDDNTNYATTTANSKDWLRKRANYIYNSLK